MIAINIIQLLEPIHQKNTKILDKVEESDNYFVRSKINNDLFFQAKYYGSNNQIDLYRVATIIAAIVAIITLIFTVFK